MERRLTSLSSKDVAVVMKQAAREMGVSPVALLEGLMSKQRRVQDVVKNDQGKFRVLGVDRFDGTDWVEGEFSTAEQAVRFAERKTKEGMKGASSPTIATVYYAYTPDGRYIDSDSLPRKRKRRKK